MKCGKKKRSLRERASRCLSMRGFAQPLGQDPLFVAILHLITFFMHGNQLNFGSRLMLTGTNFVRMAIKFPQTIFTRN